MRSIINELWHGNIIPQEDSRTNTKAMKEVGLKPNMFYRRVKEMSL